ncbi:MAG: putative outer membrane lipoprotein [Candidatus Nitrosomirales archaeon]|jgi:predicted outer membrane lipoprotein
MGDLLAEFLIQLGGTFIGAALGLCTALWLERKKKREKDDEVRRITFDSIKEELRGIRKAVSQPNLGAKWIHGEHRYEANITISSTPAYDSIISSGRFALLSADMQTRIADVYIIIHRYNEIVNRIECFYATPIFTNDELAEIVLNNLSALLLENYKSAKDAIENLFPDLKTETST